MKSVKIKDRLQLLRLFKTSYVSSYIYNNIDNKFLPGKFDLVMMEIRKLRRKYERWELKVVVEKE